MLVAIGILRFDPRFSNTDPVVTICRNRVVEYSIDERIKRVCPRLMLTQTIRYVIGVVRVAGADYAIHAATRITMSCNLLSRPSNS
jgi:hypothetical protein